MYKLIKTLIPREQCNLIASVVQNQPFREGDNQVPSSWAYPNLPIGNIMLGMLRDIISREAGKNLLPAYSYTRIYNSGDVLERHLDRDSCEWSVTINLSQTDPWPIYMNETEVLMEPGDGVLYQGTLVEHYRKAFKGIEYVQMFLHYVDADGPYKDHIFDIQKLKCQTLDNPEFKIMRDNKYLDLVYTHRNAFAKFECDSIVNHLKTKSLETAGVGDGVIVETVRRSKTYFIPKINTYKWIYSRIMDIISQTNYEFELTGIDENIQFTEYDVSYSGTYDWHVDFGRNESSSRKLSVSIQLSDEDDYDGGELEFDQKNITTKQQGTAFVFPSYKRHRVAPVTRGTRYSLVAWIAGPPFR